MNVTRQQVVAYHEAGHAVVADELGIGVMWIERNADGSGGCRTKGTLALFDDVVIDVAGVLAATFKFGPGCDPMSPRGDLIGIRRIAPEQRVKAIERASEILGTRWADVEALATRLLNDPDGFVPLPFPRDFSNP